MRTTTIPIEELDDLIDYLRNHYNELTSGDMPDDQGICYDITKYIVFLENLKRIYGICDKCERYISPDEIYSIVNEELVCSECSEI